MDKITYDEDIEISDAMREAGVAALFAADKRFVDAEMIVCLVFRAMAAACKPDPASQATSAYPK